MLKSSTALLLCASAIADEPQWLRENWNARSEQHQFKISEVLAEGETPFQDYVFIQNDSYGKMMFLDGVVQSAQSDERLYHECLVQPAMVLHPAPRSVLVVGAGEGATGREILRHSSVERIVMVDIDGEVVQKTKDLLYEWHEGAFDHPKVQLIIQDGKDFVEQTHEKFDVIILDICDKLDGGPADMLYSEEFYRSLKNILNPEGIMAIQSMEMFNGPEGNDHRLVYRNVSRVFDHVSSYGTFIPSFWSKWGFVIASDSASFTQSPEKIDQVLSDRRISLKHYDGQFHQHLFHLDRAMRVSMAVKP